jgi:hypothetical protein
MNINHYLKIGISNILLLCSQQYAWGSETASVFSSVISPIMKEKCVSCHGEEKKKGKLQLHKYEVMMKGGSDGATTVIAGKVEESLMLQRIKLPAGDDEHMPPEDEPQITAEESQLISWWIEAGASEKATVDELKPNETIRGILKKYMGAKPAAEADIHHVEAPKKAKTAPLSAEEKAKIAEVTKKMAAINATLMPVAADTEQVRLNVINAKAQFGDAELALLEPIAKHVLWLEIAQTKVTDAGLAVIAKMENLERLHLELSPVTDAGLVHLSGLKHLDYLNLYQTKITDSGMAALESIKTLKKLFLWKTEVTEAKCQQLQSQIPGLVINRGLSDADIAKLIATPMPKKAQEAKAPAKKPEPKAKSPEAPKPEQKPTQPVKKP